MSYYGGWAPYVSVQERRERALRAMEKLRKKGRVIEGVQPRGRKIAETFWGAAWCTHIEQFHDFANRLPRGRTYIRNGSVCHLEIAEGVVKAVVSGSELYNVTVKVKTLPRNRWTDLKGRCTRGIGSLLELLQGKLSESVMSVVTDPQNGLFPRVAEIDLDCSCPDWADMCKHVAAALYGVGTRLDARPELLFQLRGVDPAELVVEEAVTQIAQSGGGRRIAAADVAGVFGIELAKEAAAPATRRGARTPKTAPAAVVPGRPAGKDVAALRRKFGLTLGQFARLLGMSAPAIARWEQQTGEIRMQGRTTAAWGAVAGIDRKEARRRLGLHT